MIDEQRREPGIHVETTNIGKNRDIIKYQREYNPSIIFPMEWKDI
jgi:hypothetical protein